MSRSNRAIHENMYLLSRNASGVSREVSAGILNMSTRTLARIEASESRPDPGDVLKMGDLYEDPKLIRRHCKEACPIGRLLAPDIEDRSLAEAVLGLMKEHRDVGKKLDSLVEIASDGEIDQEERPEFDGALEELRHLYQKIHTIILLADKKKVSKNKKAPGLVAEAGSQYQYL